MKQRRMLGRLISAFFLAVMTVMVTGCSDKLIVLDPKGPIGEQQKDLIWISVVLCLIVLIPVLVMTAVIAWRYRDSKTNKAKYKPEWEHNSKLETIWWGIPILIILTLGVITAKYTYALEPSKPIASEKAPITIQVTSLDWKWLFYYPDQGIATVNYIKFPEDVPIKFLLTSDAPMNSFWIPQLGGQIYTMSGMAMTLHLQADEQGSYFGSGANFSGKDFASMHFMADATSKEDFDKWVADIKNTKPALTAEGYKQLATPGVAEIASYSSFPKGLFEQTVTKYASGHNHGARLQTQPEPKKNAEAEGITQEKEGQSHVGQH
ncbi:ubiquinol oxidase subunit II [Paenibacillus ginsengarvi]|uniref:Quinol oxidase subunit 2 n=1 Tax=Paenibacillus ginsengarvi TaxID=400777 RepID=A0A3B0AU75_9BACL|nr:ubiquinol oxidase subunit II [Paenibacillus ginsengarvi]RKN62786.1 ubiquinol oxidase subunit II [Paenibacillus ginsengarvi]